MHFTLQDVALADLRTSDVCASYFVCSIAGFGLVGLAGMGRVVPARESARTSDRRVVG